MRKAPPVVRVDLHCHSSFSDGACSPEQIADKLAAANVQWAALADHETTRGLARFQSALQRYDIQFISGVEIEVQSLDGVIHLLAYGFDPADTTFQRYLNSLRYPLWNSARRWLKGNGHNANEGSQAANAITQIHRADGIAVLAHPLDTFADLKMLENALECLISNGLDGLEAYYKPYQEKEQAMLVNLAKQRGLLVSAGSDFHGENLNLGALPGMDIPEEDWQALLSILKMVESSPG